jgi:hypothetical protein
MAIKHPPSRFKTTVSLASL